MDHIPSFISSPSLKNGFVADLVIEPGIGNDVELHMTEQGHLKNRLLFIVLLYYYDRSLTGYDI